MELIVEQVRRLVQELESAAINIHLGAGHKRHWSKCTSIECRRRRQEIRGGDSLVTFLETNWHDKEGKQC